MGIVGDRIDLIAFAEDENVAAGAAGEKIVAGLAADRVYSAHAEDMVVALVAVNKIVQAVAVAVEVGLADQVEKVDIDVQGGARIAFHSIEAHVGIFEHMLSFTEDVGIVSVTAGDARILAEMAVEVVVSVAEIDHSLDIARIG